MIQRTLLYVGFALLASTAQAVDTGLSYEGQILKPGGAPLEGQTTQFKFQIRTPDVNNCLMYEEVQTLDMRGSGGSFSLTINDGSGTRTDSTGLSLNRIFANQGSFNFIVGSCLGGSGTSYNPVAGDSRKLVVFFKDESMGSWEEIPAENINYAPFAVESKQIAGFGADSLLRVVNGSGDPVAGLAPLSNAQYSALMDLVNGTSTAFTKAGQLNGVALPSMAAGEVLGWNGTQWVAQAPSAPGPNSIMTTMIQNNAVDASKIASGAVGTSQIASNVSINTSGSIGSAITTTRDLKVYAPSPSSFYVGMLAPPLSASYTLTWPLTAGLSGQVLKTDGSGTLDWTTVGSGDFKADGTVSMAGALNMGNQNIVNVTQITAIGAFNAGSGSASLPSHTFATDTTTGLFRPVTSTLGFSTGGAEKMRINSSGNVGIGTTNPAYKVDVNGVLNATGLKINGVDVSAGPGLTGLTGDVIATGPGSVPAVVNSVGGSTASNIHSAELLANAATAANTSNAIVKRDGLGSFEANVGTFNGVVLNNSGSVTLVNPIGSSYTLTLPNSTGTSGQVLTTNGSGATSWATPLASQWTTNGSDISYTAGRVGVGTLTPQEALEVSGNVRASSFVPTNVATLGSSCSGFTAGAIAMSALGPVFCDSGSMNWKMPGPWDISSGIYYTPTGNKISLGAGIGGSAAVNIKNSVTPSYPVVRVQGMSGQTGSLLEVLDGTAATKLTVNSAGKVGIGVTNPMDYLEVGFSSNDPMTAGILTSNTNSGSNAYNGINMSNNMGSLAGVIQSSSIGGENLLIYNGSTSGGIQLMTNNTERVRIDPTGNVGIGTSSPKSTLEINGSLARKFVTVTTSSYTVNVTDTHILMNPTATATLTLPSASLFPGREISIRNISSYAVNSNSTNIAPMASASVTSAILPSATPGKWVLLVSDGTNWQTQMGN